MVALLTPIMMRRKVPRQAVFAMVVALGGILTLLYSDLAISGKTLAGGFAVLSKMGIDARVSTTWTQYLLRECRC